MKIYFSPEKVGFYDFSIKDEYVKAGSWPDDAVRISNITYSELMDGQSDGKIIAADENGNPVLVDPSPPTSDVLNNISKAKKAELMAVASKEIAPLQDAVDLGIASEVESATLNEWKKYRVNLNRVDTSTAPEIEWPDVPVSIF